MDGEQGFTKWIKKKLIKCVGEQLAEKNKCPGSVADISALICLIHLQHVDDEK